MQYLFKHRWQPVEGAFDTVHWTIMLDDDDPHRRPSELNDKDGTRAEAFSQFNGLRRIGDEEEAVGFGLPYRVYADIRKCFVQSRSPSYSLTLWVSAQLNCSQRGSVGPITFCRFLTCGNGAILHESHLHTCFARVFDQDSQLFCLTCVRQNQDGRG